MKKINEDNWSGFHSMTMSSGVNEAPSYSNIDSPVDINLPRGSSGAAGGYVRPGAGNNTFNFNFFSNNTKTINVSRAGGNGVAWFAAHMKEIAIVAAGAAILYALIKLIKGANKSIKVRYNKVVKTLQRAQIDFVTSPNGLDMRSVMPGLGSRIYDGLSRLFSLNLSKKRQEDTKRNNIGLYPFCDRYKDEIARDYKTAAKAFGKIKVASDETMSVSTSHDRNSYSSFREAFASYPINENNQLNEVAALTLLSAGAALASFAVRAGHYIAYVKDKKGNVVQKEIQATKESTREICYSIIYNYMDKYVNMENVFKQIGISSESLQDIDKSSVDKLKAILEKYKKPEKDAYSKQYRRIKEAYDNMLTHYYSIGDGIIKNFEKYTKAEKEKDANLLIAGKEKLQAMWDAQKDLFNNNFSHIVIEIASSDEYVEYLNFIIERVLPVFKTGIGGDADYVLDVVPKKGEYYVIRQTASDATIGQGATVKSGNVALAKISSFDDKEKKITFKLVGMITENDIKIVDGIAEVSGSAKIDYNVFKGDNGEKKEVTLDYGKWLSLDPITANWNDNETSDLYFRAIDKEGKPTTQKQGAAQWQYILAYRNRELTAENNSVMFEKIIFATINVKTGDMTVFEMKLPTPLSENDFDKLVKLKDADAAKDMEFEKASALGWGYFDIENEKKALINYKKEQKDVKSNEELITLVNKRYSVDSARILSEMYSRKKPVNGKNLIETVFAEASRDLESVYSNDGSMRLNEAGDTEMKIIKPGESGSDSNIVSKVYYSCVIEGYENNMSDASSGFSACIIGIDPACSINDFDRKMKSLRPDFSVVDDPDARKRNAVYDLVATKDNSKGVVSFEGQTVSIDKIEEAFDKVSTMNKDTSVLSKTDVPKKIYDTLSNNGLTQASRNLYTPRNIHVIGSKNPIADVQVYGVNPKATGLSSSLTTYGGELIKFDDNGKVRAIAMYPVLAAKPGTTNYTDPKVVLFSGNKSELVNMDQKEIENAIVKLLQ